MILANGLAPLLTASQNPVGDLYATKPPASHFHGCDSLKAWFQFLVRPATTAWDLGTNTRLGSEHVAKFHVVACTCSRPVLTAQQSQYPVFVTKATNCHLCRPLT